MFGLTTRMISDPVDMLAVVLVQTTDDGVGNGERRCWIDNKPHTNLKGSSIDQILQPVV